MDGKVPCRFCGREFPASNATVRAVHETYRCNERPADDQTDLEDYK